MRSSEHRVLGSFPPAGRLCEVRAAYWRAPQLIAGRLAVRVFTYRLELITMSLNRSSQCAATHTELIDAVMDGYVNWREESVAVAASYQHWSRAPRDARASAYDAYAAALDREEHAASEYRRLIEQAAT